MIAYDKGLGTRQTFGSGYERTRNMQASTVAVYCGAKLGKNPAFATKTIGKVAGTYLPLFV